MPLLGGITSFLDKYILGYALGTAAGPALRPFVQDLANEAWVLNPVMKPDALVLAAGVAQGQVDEPTARGWAKQHGFDDTEFSALVDIANTGPAIGAAYAAWRRGALSEGQFETALKRAAIEDQWVAALKALKQEPLDPSTIANAVHRGIMRDPTLIVREPPTTAGKVEQVPPSSIDPAEEAAWSGLNHERLRVEVGTTGLPPGLIQMLQLLNRGIVTVDDVQRAVSQSNLRNEYMDVVLALRRDLLTPHNYEEAALRGIITRAQADAGAALSGMEPADAQLLFEIMGRPLTVHQLVTAQARGGQFGGTYADVPEPYRDAIRRSNIRPEYARLAYANRYSYPSAFVLRSLAEAGDLGDTAAVENILLDIGWPPFLAAKVAPRWAPKGAAIDPFVKKAQSAAWTKVQGSYIDGDSDQAQATTALAALGVAATAIPGVLAAWDVARSVVRKELTPKQLKDAYAGGVVNPATGTPYTKDEVIGELILRGYSTADATTFLEL